MRLAMGTRPEDVTEIHEFAEWILKVRDGKLREANDGEVDIDVPKEILIDEADDPVSSIIDFNYPNILDNINDLRWPETPYPDERYISEFGNRLIYDELDYNPTQLQAEYERLYVALNTKHKSIYDTLMNSVETGQGGVYFVYGYEGIGRTFLWKTLAAGIRRKGDMVLNVASSGIASLLMSGDQTAHSRFHIPIIIDEMSTCSICSQSDLGALLKKCKLIICDEAPMKNKLCFEALDRSLRDVLRKFSQLFQKVHNKTL
ncbi:ATP-dependent DNA helicase PIF1-like protein [Tanacetum coccineum]